MQFVLEQVRLQRETAVNWSPSSHPYTQMSDHYKGPQVPKFKEGDDVDVYLRTFERLAAVHG